MKKCYLYMRVSSEQQRQGNGIERQRSSLLQYFNDNAASQDFDPQYEEILDEGRSAFKGHHLHENAGLGQFFKRVTAGEIPAQSVLIVESLDRFSRENPFKCVEYISILDRHQVELHDVGKRLIVSRKHSNSLTFATMIAERAFDESRWKSERVRGGWARRRKKSQQDGTYMIKNSPPWIDVVEDRYVLNDYAKIIRNIFDLYLSGIKSFTIAQRLNSEQKLISDKKWTGTKICRVLRNVRCKGDYITTITNRDFDTDNVSVISDVLKIYPPIVSDFEFQEVQRTLEKHNFLGRVRNDKKKTVFNGLLKCIRCGEAMTLSTTGGYSYIKCYNSREKNGCDSSMMPYAPFEKGILSHIKDLDILKVFADHKHQYGEIDEIKNKIIELNNHLDNFKQGIERIRMQGRLPNFEILDEKSQTEAKIESLRKLLLEKESVVKVTHIDFPENIHDVENVDERSKLELELRRVLKKIKIGSVDKKSILIEINYHNDNVIKHVLLLNKKTGEAISSGEIQYEDGWRNYVIKEGGKVVFKVESNGNIWTVSAAKNTSIKDIYKCMRVMVGYEPDDFEFILNEEYIEWLD